MANQWKRKQSVARTFYAVGQDPPMRALCAGLEKLRGFVGSRSVLGDEGSSAAAVSADVFVQNVHLVLNARYVRATRPDNSSDKSAPLVNALSYVVSNDLVDGCVGSTMLQASRGPRGVRGGGRCGTAAAITAEGFHARGTQVMSFSMLLISGTM